MMRLIMEAVMVLAIVGGMIFVSRVSSSENKTVRESEDADNESASL